MIRRLVFFLLVRVALLFFAASIHAQADEVCRDVGETPTREIGRQGRLASYVYGRVLIRGVDPSAKPPRVTVTYSDSGQPATRQVLPKSGNYCFKRNGNGGIIVVDIDGAEAARKSVSELGPVRQREDFEINRGSTDRLAAPGVISTKFSRPPNEQTSDLYKRAAAAERDKDLKGAIVHVKEIVSIDPDDFIAWAKLGTLYLEQNQLDEAEAAFKRSLGLRPDYTGALINLGILRALQAHYPEAIDTFKQALATEPTSAYAYRLLGEAYLQNRQGSLGLASLDEALKLDPTGMADCHLLKARLYDLVGAKNLATAEYKAFLAKVPEHPDKKKLEKYIKDNPE